LDITYAFYYGRPLVFFRDRMSKVRSNIASLGFTLDRSLAASTVLHTGLDAYLNDVLLDIMSIASLYNRMRDGLTLDMITFQEMVVSICSRLIQFRPLEKPQPTSRIDASYHLGLTIFMMTAFMQYDDRRVLECRIVSSRLEQVLDAWPEENDNLTLWLMFIGGIWVVTEKDGHWLIPRLRRLAENMGIKSFSDICRSIGGFPWIDELHNAAGRGLWIAVSLSR
jgi:hypothetical protein